MSSFYFTSLTAIFLTTLIAFFVLFKGVKTRINQVFFFFLITLSVGIFGDIFYFTPLVNFFNPKEILRSVYVIAPFSASSALHFMFLFTQTRPFKYLIPIIYGVSFSLSGFNVIDSSFFFKEIFIVSEGVLESVVSPGFYIFSLFNLVAVIATFLFVIRRLRLSKGQLKEQMKYYLFAAASIVCAALLYSLAMGISYKIPRLDNLFLVIYVATIAYSITKSELFQIQLVVSRVFSYGLTYLVAVFIFGVVNAYVTSSYLLIISNFGLLVVGITYGSKLREILQTGFDEKFISDSYDSDLVMQKMSDNLSGVNKRDDIFVSILASVKDVIKLKSSSIISADSSEGEIDSYILINGDERKLLDKKSSIVSYFQSNFDISSFRLLTKQCQDEANKIGVSKYSLFLPLYSPRNILEGILILGQKTSELPYVDNDITFFITISNYVKAILDRMRPYEKIQKEFQESQKRFFDAEIMRIQSKKNEDFAFTLKEYNHEIRTPLSIIRSRAQDLPEKTDEDKEFKHAILLNVERANDIVGTTLRLTADDIKEKKENRMPQHINKIIEDVIEYKFHKTNIDIITEFEDSSLFVLGVKSELEHIFLNILQNSNDALPDGGKINIRGYKLDTDVEISIKDNGIGISEKDLPKVFELHRSRHVTKGRGLGLSFVHKLVMEHNGKVSINSTEGKGTEVLVQLPSAKY